MKQFTQFVVVSSLGLISSAVTALPPENTSRDVRAQQSPTAEDVNRSPAVEPRVFVEQDGALYYYDYPRQVSHAEQKAP